MFGILVFTWKRFTLLKSTKRRAPRLSWRKTLFSTSSTTFIRPWPPSCRPRANQRGSIRWWTGRTLSDWEVSSLSSRPALRKCGVSWDSTRSRRNWIRIRPSHEWRERESFFFVSYFWNFSIIFLLIQK